MIPTWKDSSAYSRGERGTKEPTAWELDLDGMRVVVHRLHGVTEPLWFGSCYAMGVERRQLESADLAMARREFIDYLLERSKRWAFKLDKARTDVDHKAVR